MINEHGMLAVKAEPGKIVLIKVSEIVSLRAAGNYVELHFDEGRALHRATMHSVMQRLPSYFIQIHRSHVINLNHLKVVQSELGRYSECVMSDGRQLPIGAQFKGAFMNALGTAEDSLEDGGAD